MVEKTAASQQEVRLLREPREGGHRAEMGQSSQNSARAASPVRPWTQVRLSETDTWRRNMEQKAIHCGPTAYREHKQVICVEPLFDNSVASSLLFEARAGALSELWPTASVLMTAWTALCAESVGPPRSQSSTWL
ncbi:hypothetical protein MTO96_044599 [Rhipicephalus appendiculatus]